jgi:hypothetical protein
MDPIGFALEGFDAAGRVRTHESGVPVDDSGALHATSLGTIRIDGEESLAHELAALPEVDACVTTFEAVHLFGVGEEEARCLAESGRRVLDDGGSLLDAWIALAGSPHFATRAP